MKTGMFSRFFAIYENEDGLSTRVISDIFHLRARRIFSAIPAQKTKPVEISADHRNDLRMAPGKRRDRQRRAGVWMDLLRQHERWPGLGPHPAQEVERRLQFGDRRAPGHGMLRQP